MMITSGDPQPCCSKRMDATEFSEEHGPPRKVQKVKRSRKSGKLHKLIARAIDCKTVAFFLKIGLAYLSVRVASESVGRVRRKKKTDCTMSSF